MASQYDANEWDRLIDQDTRRNQDAAIIANRKYELRNTPKGAKVKGDGFGTGEVWDHELQMYYRKRYD